MGPPESVQTIFTQNFQHIGKLFNFLVQPLLNLSVPHILWDTQITVISSPELFPQKCANVQNYFFSKLFLQICHLYEIIHHISLSFLQLANY